MPENRRWLCVYLPVLILAGVVLYVVSDLIMKQLALHTLKTKMAALPDLPTTAAAVRGPGPPEVRMPPPPMMHVPLDVMTANSSLHSYVLNPLSGPPK